MDSDRDSDDWVLLDAANPADSSDDDRGVLALPASAAPTPAASDDDSDADADVLFPASDSDSDYDADADADVLCPASASAADDTAYGLYDPSDAEEPPRSPAPPPPKPLSGLFHHTYSGDPAYAAFDPALCWPDRDVVHDPSFSACTEPVAALASARGLVCLRGAESGRYYVANPATLERRQLPCSHCDHLAHGEPAVVLAFEDPSPCCAHHAGHYHVAVAFPLGDGVYAYEAFSSRTWAWTVASSVSAAEIVVAASGVGALGCAFWRTTIGYFICYDPAAGVADLVPAPQEVLQWPCWELGEMGGTLCATCMDDRACDVVVIRLHMDRYRAGEVAWTLAAHFEGGCLRNRQGVSLLRTQGSNEVVMWDPMAEIVVAMDLEGRTMRTVGPLTGQHYLADFIPYISSTTGISRVEAGEECVAAVEEEN
ncbi:hypothetical protein ACP4OV_023304 [Aristida adscensionis]